MTLATTGKKTLAIDSAIATSGSNSRAAAM